MKQIILIFLLSIQIPVLCQELIPDSSEKLIIKDSLVGKSKEFLRYARNEIFARHGYIFNDPDLALFFRNQKWYNSVEKNVKLNSVETENVNILMQAEQNFGYADSEIRYKTVLEEIPIYYLAYKRDLLNLDKNGKSYRYWRGYLISLSKENIFLTKCSSIPPEILLSLADKKIDVTDDSRPVETENIKVINLTKNCGGTKHQISLELEGPSDDPELYVFYIYKNGLEMLLHVPEEFMRSNCISKEIARMTFMERGGNSLRGNIWYDVVYEINLLENSANKISSDRFLVDKDTWNVSVLSETPIYSSIQDAIKKGHVNFYIPKGAKVLAINTLEKGAILIKYKGKEGWIGPEEYTIHFPIDLAD